MKIGIWSGILQKNPQREEEVKPKEQKGITGCWPKRKKSILNRSKIDKNTSEREV